MQHFSNLDNNNNIYEISSIVKYTNISLDDWNSLVEFHKYFEDQLNKNIKNLSPELSNKIIQKIFELFSNVFRHSQSELGFFCAGQIYDNNNAAGANGQVLSTNSSGQVVWQNNIAITPIAIGVMNNTAPSNPINSANYNTGAYIDLPAGKWVVNTTMLLRKTGGLLTSGAALWIRAGFSTSSVSYIQAGNTLSGSLVGPSQYGLMNGIVVINNASGSTQRYYLWRTKSEFYGTATGNEVLDNFADDFWAENQIVATPVN